jgi:hypothetical protein
MGEPDLYPAASAARDTFILDRRGPRPAHDPWQHQGLIVEDERTADGTPARVATVLLTGRECPWRCAMCDLWRYTTATDTPLGAIPAQIATARAALHDQPTPVTGIKLYNAGSFFDPRAVPDADYGAVAGTLAGLSRVIVESHPALVSQRIDRFLAALARFGDAMTPRLEVAMGLETAHPDALDRLNKHFTFDKAKRWTGQKYRAVESAPWASSHTGQDAEWSAFTIARRLNEPAAMRSISMGASQVMGFNYSVLGYDSVREMFDHFSADERYHILGLFDFVKGPAATSRMLEALRRREYEQFATYYNGNGQAAEYGARIRSMVSAFEKIAPASLVDTP